MKYCYLFAGIGDGLRELGLARAVKRKLLPSVVSCAALTCVAGSAHAVTRISVTLDDLSTVTADNMSSFSDATVRTLVLAADRSTVDGCPYDAPDRKGLFKTGDRIIVSSNYLAWLDLTKQDGAGFFGDWNRGELAGFWALNPSTQTFKFFTPASSGTCWNWPRNQLIPGSASPGGQKFFWDKYAPPTEQSISIVTRLDPTNPANDTKVLFSHFYSKATLVTDGQVNPDGTVYYKFTALLANGTLKPDATGQVDITDGNDANGITATLTSELEFYFRGNDVMTAWRFKPSRQISADNIYMGYWVAYGNGQDMDGTACDTDPAVDQWPSKSYTTNWYAESSVPLVPNFATGGFPAFHQFPAGTPVQMVLAPKCSNPYVNNDINTSQYATRNNTQVGNGTWLRVGEGSPPHSSGRPYFSYIHQMPNPAGTGTYSSPFDVRFNRMLAAHESHDGVLGFAVASGPYSQRADYSTFAANKWYYALHILTSAY